MLPSEAGNTFYALFVNMSILMRDFGTINDILWRAVHDSDCDGATLALLDERETLASKLLYAICDINLKEIVKESADKLIAALPNESISYLGILSSYLLENNATIYGTVLIILFSITKDFVKELSSRMQSQDTSSLRSSLEDLHIATIERIGGSKISAQVNWRSGSVLVVTLCRLYILPVFRSQGEVSTQREACSAIAKQLEEQVDRFIFLFRKESIFSDFYTVWCRFCDLRDNFAHGCFRHSLLGRKIALSHCHLSPLFPAYFIVFPPFWLEITVSFAK